MTPICTAPMPTDTRLRRRYAGLTLIELVVAVVMVSLFATLAVPTFFALLRKNTFRGHVEEFVSTMQMAAAAAAESNRRYEVIIDLTEQSYLLREITSPDIFQVLEEEIIVDNYFSDKCYAAYVMFDDIDYSQEGTSYTNEGRAKFRAGHAGWQYGGKIVLLDEDDQPYSVVITRMNRIVKMEKGDVEILTPRRKDEVMF